MPGASYGVFDQSRDNAPLVAAARVLRERWPIIVATTAVCLGVVLVFSLTATKQYEGSSSVLLSQSDLTSLIDPTGAATRVGDPQRDQGTNLLLLKSGAVAKRVKDALHLPDDPGSLLNQITVTAEPDANIIHITASDADPVRAAQLADGFANQFVAYRAASDQARIARGEALLTQQLAQLPATDTANRAVLRQALQKVTALRAVTTGDSEVVDHASVPAAAASPRPKRDAALGLVLGLVAGLSLAFLVDLFDRRVKTVEDLESGYGLRALAAVPESRKDPSTSRERQAVLEPFRILRNGVDFLAVSGEVRVIMVTSAMPGEGKSTVAAGLARAAALAGQRVVLVEADLRRPTFHEQFALGDDPRGLTNALVGGVPVRDLLRFALSGMRTLSVLPSGPLPPNSAELLRSAAMAGVLRELAEDADLVILDAPPLLPVADAQVLLDNEQLDACLVVGRLFHTTRDEVRRARVVLERHRMTSLGLVVNGVRQRDTSYTYYATADAGATELPTPSS
jgi:capsular exopolysaccharide synthesis family protein